jgi:hypothetical protein
MPVSDASGVNSVEHLLGLTDRNVEAESICDVQLSYPP